MTGIAMALQIALFDALVGDGPLGEVVTGIYDHVPGGAALPYITLGSATMGDWSAVDFDGHDHDLTIDVWATGPGHGHAKTIMDRVQGALHDRDLAIAGADLVLLRFQSADVFIDADGTTVHGVMRFRALTRNT